MTRKGDNAVYLEMPVKINVNNQLAAVLPFNLTMNVIILRLIHYVLAVSTFMKQWLLRIPSLSFNKTGSLAVQADARKLKKLPLHMGMIILEDEMSYTDIANFIIWSAAMGISFVSVYDTSDRGSSQIDVFLLSLKDGRQSIVNMARHICHQVSHKQIKSTDLSPLYVDQLFQEETGYADPDLVIRFGNTEALMGFMPWHVRLTEILSLPTHFGLEYKTFKSLLVSYGTTEQRFGK